MQPQQQEQLKPVESMELPRMPEPAMAQQPKAQQGMDPMRPHDEPEMNMRGGEGRGGCCPGRFCFIIPCPLPCDCCIIPCPC